MLATQITDPVFSKRGADALVMVLFKTNGRASWSSVNPAPRLRRRKSDARYLYASSTPVRLVRDDAAAFLLQNSDI